MQAFFKKIPAIFQPGTLFIDELSNKYYKEREDSSDPKRCNASSIRFTWASRGFDFPWA